MLTIKPYSNRRALGLATIFLATMISGCGHSSKSDPATPPVTPPVEAPAYIINTTNPSLDVEMVPVNNSVMATFGEEMDQSTITTESFTLQGADEAPVVGEVSFDRASNTAIFKPTGDLTPNTVYTATITTAVKTAAGVSLVNDYVWTFKTGELPDTNPPKVSATNPVADEVDVVLNRSVSAMFDESLMPTSNDASSFTLTTGATAVLGTVIYADKLVTFKPNVHLEENTLYTATLTAAVKDLAGNALAENHVWNFTTGTEVAKGPAPVNLLTAGHFVILSKTATTNVPDSQIVGNIGASPITAAAIGVPCSNITGTIYGADAAYTGGGVNDVTCFKGEAEDITLVANAVLDMGTAFTDAAGRSIPDFTELYAGDISGQTLEPGLYKWGTNVWINSNVTLAGGANDVWIFQIAGDVIQASDTEVMLSGGALSKNIFWQVSGGAGVQLNTGASFAGVALTAKAINLKTGATVNGRLLSQTTVTLQKNNITQPAN